MANVLFINSIILERTKGIARFKSITHKKMKITTLI